MVRGVVVACSSLSVWPRCVFLNYNTLYGFLSDMKFVSFLFLPSEIPRVFVYVPILIVIIYLVLALNCSRW